MFILNNNYNSLDNFQNFRYLITSYKNLGEILFCSSIVFPIKKSF